MLESMSEKEAHIFVTAYGTYLDLSESLVAAAECKAKNTIDILLRMASKYDVRHKKAVQEFSCIIDNTPKAVRIGEQVRRLSLSVRRHYTFFHNLNLRPSAIVISFDTAA